MIKEWPIIACHYSRSNVNHLCSIFGQRNWLVDNRKIDSVPVHQSHNIGAGHLWSDVVLCGNGMTSIKLVIRLLSSKKRCCFLQEYVMSNAFPKYLSLKKLTGLSNYNSPVWKSCSGHRKLRHGRPVLNLAYPFFHKCFASRRNDVRPLYCRADQMLL